MLCTVYNVLYTVRIYTVYIAFKKLELWFMVVTLLLEEINVFRILYIFKCARVNTYTLCRASPSFNIIFIAIATTLILFFKFMFLKALNSMLYNVHI